MEDVGDGEFLGGYPESDYGCIGKEEERVLAHGFGVCSSSIKFATALWCVVGDFVVCELGLMRVCLS
jgi:hypothetical protein